MPLSSKTGGGQSRVTSTENVVDFKRLILAVPIRLDHESKFIYDILFTQQGDVNFKKKFISTD